MLKMYTNIRSSKMKQIHKILAPPKYWLLYKILASHENVGGYPKYWRLMKILADTQNIGGCPKYWRVSKILAPAENQEALLFRLGRISCC